MLCQLSETYGSKALNEVGLTFQGKASTRWMEDEDAPGGKLIIPYLTVDGSQVLYLRAHKMGPPGIEIELYGQPMLANRPSCVVLAEGELKALALGQCGIPSLGLPGISSFIGKHFSRLRDLLTRFGVESVVVLFDNEVKDDPTLSSYKSDPMKRWDTDYYACAMALKLFSTRAVTSALVARLPDEWRVEGKIDPDGALAQGKRPYDLQKVIENATIPQKHLERLSREGRIVVSYKLQRDKLHRSPLQEKAGVYLWEERRGENKVVSTISNFVLEPLHQVRRSERSLDPNLGTLERVYRLQNNLGEEATISLFPQDLTSRQRFEEKIFNVGNFLWEGMPDAFRELKKRLFTLSTPKIAEETESFGRQDDDTWVFSDGIVMGENAYPLQGGVVWGTGLRGRIPLQDSVCPAPALIGVQEEPLDLCDAYDVLKRNLGTPAIGLGLGWALGCAFSDEIFAKLGFYPLLSLISPARSGKTLLGIWLTSMWGIPRHSQNPIRLDGTTFTGLERTLAKFSSMPVFVDEFRNSLRESTIHGLRSTYDRSAGVKGVKSNDNKTRGSRIRGCLLFGGEEYPADPALLSRCVHISLREDARIDSLKEKAEEQVARLRGFVLSILKRRRALIPRVLDYIEGAYSKLQSISLDERLTWCYAVVFGVFSALLPNKPTSKNREGAILAEIYVWLKEELKRIFLEREQDNHENRFFIALNILATTYETGGFSILNRQHVGLSRDCKTLFVWFSGAYQKYERMTAPIRTKTVFNENSLRSYVRALPYAIGIKKRRLGGHNMPGRSCFGFDLTHEEIPSALKELAELIKLTGWDQPGANFPVSEVGGGNEDGDTEVSRENIQSEFWRMDT